MNLMINYSWLHTLSKDATMLKIHILNMKTPKLNTYNYQNNAESFLEF